MRIVAAQHNYHVGHFEHNFQTMAATVQAHGQETDLIVFTELCLTGYYPYDLINRASFIREQHHTLDRLIALSRTCQAALVVGWVEPNPGKGKAFFNSVAVIHQGEIVYRYRKQLLPVYNIFDEARHFQPAGEQACFDFKGTRIAFLICEDAWGDYEHIYDRDPVTHIKDQDPDLVIVLNASPSNLGKFQTRLHHTKRVAVTLNKPLLYVNQVGGNDEIVYDGSSFALDQNGQLLGTLKCFEEDVGVISFNNHIQLQSGFGPQHSYNDGECLIRMICLGLRDYLRKSGFDRVVVGVSGGIDSAVTLSLATMALGKDKVHAVFMPTQYTHSTSEADSLALTEALQIPMYRYPLAQSFELALKEFKDIFGETPSSLTQENLQARLRGRILMEYSNHTGALVLSTGNKSEVSVGYMTLYGDMTGGLNLIGDVYKMQVYELAKSINKQFGHTVIPEHTMTREPTAELAPNQKDTDSLPPYDQLDAVLKLYLEGDLLREDERAECIEKVKTMDKALIEKLHKRVDRAEFKRRQAAPIIRVQRRSFGWGRKMPITAYYG